MLGLAMRFREPFNAWSHLVGLVLAAAGTGLLLTRADTPSRWVAFTVYGGSLILLYAASTLYHGLHLSPRRLRSLRTLDHIAIYFLIAGTYTPVSLLTLGRRGRTLLAAAWGIAAAGIPFKIRWLDAPVWLSTGHLSRHGVPGAPGRGPHRPRGRGERPGLADRGRAGLHRRCGDLRLGAS